MNTAQFRIKKVRKSGMLCVGYLSAGKTRWLSEGRVNKVGRFTEKEADEFIEKQDQTGDYYYFKTILL